VLQDLLARALTPTGLWAGLWPLAAGALIVALVMLPLLRNASARVPPVPPGDLLLPIERSLRWLGATAHRIPAFAAPRIAPALTSRPPLAVTRIEARLRSWSVAGVALLVLLGLLVALLAHG